MTHNDDEGSNSSAPNNRPRSLFGFNTSFSTSGSVGASTKTSLSQSDPVTPPATIKMAGPFDLETWWPDRSPASLALSSSYSPLNLRYLTQPIPNDASSDIDTSVFTFEDAFEDLLAVSQGQEMPELATRYAQRKLLRSMFPEGEPAYFWLRRLRSQGLLQVPEPSQFVRQAESNWDHFHRELDRRASNVWRAVSGEDARDSRDVYEDSNNFPESLRNRSESDQRRRGPDHFDDFFSSIRSTFSDSNSSWDTFVKTFHDEPSRKPQVEKLDQNQEVTKDEYVDRFGYLHSKVTVKTLDENGNQIGSQTHYTVRPADKQDHNKADSSDKDEKPGVHVSGNVQTKTGWIWK